MKQRNDVKSMTFLLVSSNDFEGGKIPDIYYIAHLEVEYPDRRVEIIDIKGMATETAKSIRNCLWLCLKSSLFSGEAKSSRAVD